MQDQITRPIPVPEPEPVTPPAKGEAKNDMLAWGALLGGFFMWPLGILFGHVSNRAAKREHRRRSMLAVVGLVLSYLGLSIVSVFVIATVAAGSSTTPAVAAPAPPASSAPAVTTPTEAPAAPASSAPAPAKPAAPEVTVSQQQALDSARSYLDMGGFSRAGLINQLHQFEKFPEADATWAADHSGADWNAQAVLSAKSYMDMGGFSRGSLIDQLHQFEKFTLAQATYAANHVGL